MADTPVGTADRQPPKGLEVVPNTAHDGPFGEIYADAVIGASYNKSTVTLLLAAEKTFYEDREAKTRRVEAGRILMPTHMVPLIYAQFTEVMKILSDKKLIEGTYEVSTHENKEAG